MRLLLDTNIILDFYEEREPFLDAAEQILRECAEGSHTGLVSASSMTDIYFLLSRSLNKTVAIDCVRKLLDMLEVAEVNGSDLHRAVASNIPDFEDAVVSFCAKRAKVDYIITRNKPDFEQSPIPSLTPDEFLAFDLPE